MSVSVPGNPATAPGRLPVIFISHRAPTLALDRDSGAELRSWADSMQRPTALLVISAHWQEPSCVTGATETLPLIYDFSGFPKELYRIRYPAPGAPELAARVHGLLAADFPVSAMPARGWDHGVWVPLSHMYPQADVPVLQLALPESLTPGELLTLGARLQPLRQQGVLIVGSGSMTHNLRELDPAPDAAVPMWAHSFDSWCAERLVAGDATALAEFSTRGPQARRAHPTHEHLLPLLVVAGAGGLGGPLAAGPPPAVGFPISGFELGSLSRRCVQIS